MNYKPVAKENKILEIRAGSQLYGTDTPTSDLDKVGVFLTPLSALLGMNNVEQVDLSIEDKGDDGRNTKDAVDFKLYDLRKFISLAIDNNPNILELLFVNPGNLLFKTEVGQVLLDNNQLFPYKELIKRFQGYAQSQKHKMRVKTKHWHDIQRGYEALQKLEQDKRRERVDHNKDLLPDYFNITPNHIVVGDVKIQNGVNFKRARQLVERRYNKFSSRSSLISKHGFDTKFGSHLVRLLTEGIELLETGRLEFPLKKADLIKDVKQGKYDVDEVLEMSDELEEQVDEAYENTDLPSSPRFDEINQLHQDLLGMHVQENFSPQQRYAVNGYR